MGKFSDMGWVIEKHCKCEVPKHPPPSSGGTYAGCFCGDCGGAVQKWINQVDFGIEASWALNRVNYTEPSVEKEQFYDKYLSFSVEEGDCKCVLPMYATVFYNIASRPFCEGCKKLLLVKTVGEYSDYIKNYPLYYSSYVPPIDFLEAIYAWRNFYKEKLEQWQEENKVEKE